MVNELDIIVGGGGVAGVAAAAALHQLGYRVGLVEPGQNDARRLAGEVFHPPGVAGLAELGLLPALLEAPMARIKGFSVSSAAPEVGPIRLAYDEVGAHETSGLGVEHGIIRHYLLNAVAALGVSVLRGKRVIAVDQSDRSRVMVTVANGSAIEQYGCRLVIAADGAQSRMARSLGIAIRQRRISTLFGYRIARKHLWDDDYGHVIFGAPAPILLYPISRNDARILFDVPHVSGRLPQIEDCFGMSSVLPSCLRQEVERAIASQSRMSAFANAITPDRAVEDRVVLVGDAAGACHPLTASGMTRCISDALLLRDAIAEQPKSLARALQNYQRRRRWPQATRLTLADALREAFCGATVETRILRGGIMSYCRASATGRAATMALLSTAEGRPRALLREIINVAMRGYSAHLRAPLPPDENSRVSAYRIMNGLFAVMFRQVKQIFLNAGPLRRSQPSLPNAAVSEHRPHA
jgi:squalene monooxygenase